jgi:hypothetical protein
MRALRTIATTALRPGASAASLSSSVLERTAAALRRAAGEPPAGVGVEHRGGFRVVEPRVPSRQAPAPQGAATPSATTPAAPATPAAPTAPATPATPPAPAATAAPSPARKGSTPTRGQRISNPKAARAVRKRQAAASASSAPTTPGVDVSGDTHHGGAPVSVEAENTPSERARAKGGRQPAPMGAREPS